jgi:hypothetical protein
MPAAAIASNVLRRIANWALRRHVVGRARHAHQAAQPEAGIAATSRRGPALRGRDAALGGLAADVDLDADIEGLGALGAPRERRRGHPGAVHGVHPVEGPGHVARLVALQVADVVPGRAEVGQGLELGQGFLDVTLAEIALAGGERRANRFGGCDLLTATSEMSRLSPCNASEMRRRMACRLTAIGDIIESTFRGDSTLRPRIPAAGLGLQGKEINGYR